MRKLLLILSVVMATTAEAQVPVPDTARQALTYRVEASATAGCGDYAPLWLTANRQGLSGVETRSAYLRAGVAWRRELNRGWRVGAGLDLAGTYGQIAPFVMQQAYADVGWRWGNLSLGSKERWPEMKDPELSSGAMVEGSNARPVPQARLEIPEYVAVPGTKQWLALKGHIAYGRFTDDGWQRDFARRASNYLTDVFYHSKSIYFRLGRRERFPLELEFGLLMAAQFGGKVYAYDADRRAHLLYDLPSGIDDALKMIIPSAGGDDTPGGEQVNVYGNHVGSWNFALTAWPTEGWRVRLYYEHMFEDHSQMFFQYGRWRDGHIGVQVDFPRNRWLSTLVWEGLGTKDQSGPILYDGYAGAMPEYQVSANDDYYNNGLYLGWQHWGMGMGNPLLPGPLYNADHIIRFRSNRVLAHHVGLCGEPAQDWSWRVLVSYVRHWGRYRDPLDNVQREVHSLCEVRWRPRRWQGWSAAAALGLDRGSYLGDNTGIQLTVRKDGWLGRNAKKALR